MLEKKMRSFNYNRGVRLGYDGGFCFVSRVIFAFFFFA